MNIKSKKILVFSFIFLLISLFLIIIHKINYSPNLYPDNLNSIITPIAKSKSCKIGGCSNQLCIDSNSSGVSTCEYKSEYSCYKSATCEIQSNGNCGWTQTEELKKCITNSKQ